MNTFEKISLPSPHIKSSEIVFKEYLTIQKDKLVTPAGIPYSYYTVKTQPHAAMVIATTTDGRFVLNKEYRHAIRKHLLSCPGGLIDKGEQPIEGAKRELLEETGFTADEFTLMGEAYPLPGILEQSIFYVRAKGARRIQEP